MCLYVIIGYCVIKYTYLEYSQLILKQQQTIDSKKQIDKLMKN